MPKDPADIVTMTIALPGRFHPIHALLAVTAAVTLWSAVRPRDYGVWLFEIAIGLLGVSVLTVTYRRFRFSSWVYLMVGIHFIVLALGAKYTYAEMPLFSWLRDTLDLTRNHYDRVGHFSQGFFPAFVVREVLLRTTPLSRGKMIGFLAVAVCLGLSAFWELLEWWMVVVFYPSEGPGWLGMQGDPWDAQQDMLMALMGASLAVLLLSKVHDRSMARLPTT